MKIVVGFEDPHYQDPPPERYTFAELVAGREKEFPILAEAAPRSELARDVEIQWIDRDGKLHKNYQQIVRSPYTAHPVAEGSWTDPEVEAEAKDEALTKFLTACEQTLRDGVPSVSRSISGMPLRSCGGVIHYLGRELLIGDRIRLRPLREPMYRRYLWKMDNEGNMVALAHAAGEWIAEFSLQVSDG